ncbi:MAG: HAMP domain-containing sensor histidine kinase [Candidatus Omnitrophota bacterium]
MFKDEVKDFQKDKIDIISALAIGVNHDICNPLGIARGQCEMFLLNLEDGVYESKTEKELLEKAADIMNKVIRETDRVTVITRRLASFARCLKSEKTEDIEIKKEMEEIISRVREEEDFKEREIRLEIKDDTLHVSADGCQIREVLCNVIQNAAEAAGDKGKVEIQAKKTDDGVSVEVKDNGPGINEKDAEKIFDPFFTTKKAANGAGLGLFIAKQIMEKNKDTMQVKSNIGEGTVFTLRFSDK